MPVDNTIERFAAHHFTLNSITKERQAASLKILRRYEAFLGKPVEQGNDETVTAYMASLLEAGLAASTVNWHLRAVMSMYRWCWRHRVIDDGTWLRLCEVKRPRGSRPQPRPYSRKELRRMWAELDAKFPYTTDLRVKRWHNGTSRFRGPIRRHAMRLQLNAIIELALVCGLRRVEIYRLSIDDAHWDNEYIVVHGKRHDQNDKVREVPYPDSTREAMRAWFRTRAMLAPEPGLPIWLSVTGAEPAAAMPFRRLGTVLRSFGDWQLHRLRHTCATERLRAGMSLQALKDFMGHAHISQTLAYTKLVREDIHKASRETDATFQRAIRAA